MKSTLTKFCLYLIFIISLITGIGDLAGGAASIPGFTGIVAASIDNELRCLAIFWLAFGVFCCWIARKLNARSAFIPAVVLIILLSGLARALSILTVGMPSTIFIVAMIVELAISIIIYLSHEKS